MTVTLVNEGNAVEGIKSARLYSGILITDSRMTRLIRKIFVNELFGVVESGTSRNAAAKQFDVSISFVVKLMQRWKQRGTIKADKYGGWKKSKLAPHGDRIRALVMENCDITIDELCVLLAAEGIAKRSTLGDFLLAQGLLAKKDSPRRRAGAP